jgi:hypothetical protein
MQTYIHICAYLQQKLFLTKVGEKNNTRFMFNKPVLYITILETI